MRWAYGIHPTALHRMAEVSAGLFKEPERWIHRRVERVYFKDYRSVHHQVSVDFTLPYGLPRIGRFKDQDVYVAPLFLLLKSPIVPHHVGQRPRRRYLVAGPRRRDLTREQIPTAPYSNIDLCDGDGQRRPLLTRRQSSLLAGTMLLDAARSATDKPIDDDLERRLTTIVSADLAEAASALEHVLRKPASHDDARQDLRADMHFPELAAVFASHSLVVCMFMDGPPPRSILKLSYEESIDPRSATTKGKFRRSLGWKSEQIFVQLNEIGASASYHVEIEVPSELEVNAVGISGTTYALYGRRLQALGSAERDYFIQQIGRADEGNVYIPDPLPGRRVGAAWVKLRARRSGFLRGALAAALITMGVLVAAVLNVEGVVEADRSEAAVASLLLLPTLLAAYVARSGEHAITTKMLTWARLALVLDAALPFAAALFLMTTPTPPGSLSLATALRQADATPGLTNDAKFERAEMLVVRARVAHARAERQAIDELRWKWLVLAIASVALVGLFVISTVAPMPHGKTIYKPLPSRSGAGGDGSAR